MKTNRISTPVTWALACCGLLGAPLSAQAHNAHISGITGTTFNLTASPAHISTADGGSVLVWGYGVQGGVAQYPGPTLIEKQGDTITVNLTNNLPEVASIVFQGISGVTATGGAPGLLTTT